MTESAEAYFEQHKARQQPTEGGPETLRGGAISVAMQYGNALLQIVSVIVLARLLVPEDFGLVAISGIGLSIAVVLVDRI